MITAVSHYVTTQIQNKLKGGLLTPIFPEKRWKGGDFFCCPDFLDFGNIKRGEHEVTITTLDKIAKALGKNASQIVKEAGF